MIKVGDLVMVVHAGCKCAEPALGRIFTVSHIDVVEQIRCTPCRRWYQFGKRRPIWSGPGVRGLDDLRIPIGWLKKIDPPSLDEDIKEKKELTA